MTFSDYPSALEYAQTRARETGRAQGIESRRDYGVGPVRWSVRPLPKPSHRFGADLRCQPVEPDPVSCARAM